MHYTSLQSTDPTAIRCLVLRGLPVILGDDASMFFKSSLVSKIFWLLFESVFPFSYVLWGWWVMIINNRPLKIWSKKCTWREMNLSLSLPFTHHIVQYSTDCHNMGSTQQQTPIQDHTKMLLTACLYNIMGKKTHCELQKS